MQELSEYTGRRWDVVVIGGGATGAGTLRDLAMRGVKALLLEQRDLVHGTSSRFHGLLHSGAPGNLILPISYTDCIVVPQVATFELQDKVYVYKIVDGKASSVMIDVEKINNGREYIVKSGLVPGDVIVAEGVGLLREGTPIVAKTQGAAPQAAPAAAAQTETEKEE